MSTELEELRLLLRALAFAAHKHKDQRRKDAEASPYINHPIALANILCSEGNVTDVVVICAALLHDTLEDTDTTPAEIDREFGRTICGIVLELTDDKFLLREERKRLQIERAAHASYAARLVKLADKTANLRDLHVCPPANWNVERRREYFDWAKQVVDELRGTHPLLEAAFDAAYTRRPA